jgi:hypothetical protein
MKKFIIGILTFILVLTFTLIPTTMFLKKTIKEDILRKVMTKQVATKTVEVITSTDEKIDNSTKDKIKDKIENNEEFQSVVNKYSDKILQDITKNNIDDVNIKEDVIKIIEENKQIIEQDLDTKMDNQEIEDIVDKLDEELDLNSTYKKTIIKTKNELPKEARKVLKIYNIITDNNTLYLLIGLSILNIIIITVLKKPHFKSLTNISVAGIISSIDTSILIVIIGLIFNLAIENIEYLKPISVVNALIIELIIFIISIVLLIINSIINKKYKSSKDAKNAIS